MLNDPIGSYLHVGVNDELGEPKDLSAEVERVAEPRLLSLLGRQRLHRLQVEVVVQVEVVQVLAMDQKIQHVVALAANLKTDLDPVEAGRLEKLGGLE